jgi:hypothetical protein
MFLFGTVTPETAVKSCAAALAAGVCGELSLLSAAAEYLLLRPGIAMADKASAVNVSVAIDFFIVGILFGLALSEKPGGGFVKGRFFTTPLPRVNETTYTSGSRQYLPVLHRFKMWEKRRAL